MPLTGFEVERFAGPIPADVREFLHEADRRISQFQCRGGPLSFVASNFEAAYRLLRGLSESTLLRGNRFCEWGSGFGVVASLASMLDFESSGIEIQGDLVDEARKLAEDFDLDVAFAHGSFVPRGAEARVHAAGTYAWLTTEGDFAYEELGVDLDDMDVVFAYPWPDEEAVTLDVFAHYAGEGAVIASYHGEDLMQLRRKTARSKRKSRRNGRR
jgi:hypothetical protein